MDTINHMTAVAAQAVWGDQRSSTQEPVSGRKGDVSKGEPYDAGNIESTDHVTATNQLNNTTSAAASSIKTTDKSSSTTVEPITATGPTTTGYSNTEEPVGIHGPHRSRVANAADPRIDSDRDHRAAGVGAGTGTTSTGTFGLGFSTATGADIGARGVIGETGAVVTSTNPTTTTGSTDRVDLAGVVTHASQVQDSSTTTGDSTFQQNDTRDPADPSTHPANAAPMENVNDTTDGLDTGDNPAKVDGPGPKPVATLARERGGDAGNVNTDIVGASDGTTGTTQHEGGHAKDPAQDEYVKSTGLAADGGDFDAIKPGAGAEADRLKEKGIHLGGLNKVAESDAAADAHEGTGKPKLMERIKAKFHKH